MTQPAPDLEADCTKCFGLCCIALNFNRVDGFGHDKTAGMRCHFLEADYRCAIHTRREDLGYEGCIDFDCFGAGQKASKEFAAINWQQDTSLARQLYARFAELMALQEMRRAIIEAVDTEDDDERRTVLAQLERLVEQPHRDDFQDVLARAKRFIATLEQV